MSYRIGVDIGGTFTDFILFDAAGQTIRLHKRLTTPRDPSAALGFVNAMKDLPDHTKPGDKLYVFSLG